MIRLVAIAAVVVALVLIVRAVSRAGSVFLIRVRGGRATIRGSVPGRSDAEILEFVDSLGLPEGASIRGARGGDGFRVIPGAGVPPPQHQRIRNFLYFK